MDETQRRVFGQDRRVSFARFMDVALYDPEIGFYTTKGSAGQRGDFLTSPEVGPLFGAVIARQLDDYWQQLGSPDVFSVVELGAGPGTLARTIAFAAPQCLPHLRYVAVELSKSQRLRHGEHLENWHGDITMAEAEKFCRGEQFTAGFSSCAVPPKISHGVFLANELFDNLPFDIVRFTKDGHFEQLMVDIDEDISTSVEPIEITGVEADVLRTAQVDQWIPRQRQARQFVDELLASLEQGFFLAFDYGATTNELSQRINMGWLRTYAQHEKSDLVFADPGNVDITADVAVDQLVLNNPATLFVQSDWLRARGIEQLVEEGKEFWRAHAHAPATAALVARSRIGEAEALCDEAGLGSFVVFEWEVKKNDII